MDTGVSSRSTFSGAMPKFVAIIWPENLLKAAQREQNQFNYGAEILIPVSRKYNSRSCAKENVIKRPLMHVTY